MNKVILTGYLGADPEFKTLESGANMCKLRLATSSTYKNRQGERVTDTQWHKLIAWGPNAENLTHFFNKGDAIQVEGELTYNDWQDKDGNKRRDAVVKIERWHFPEKSGVKEVAPITDAVTGKTEMVAEADLPF